MDGLLCKAQRSFLIITAILVGLILLFPQFVTAQQQLSVEARIFGCDTSSDIWIPYGTITLPLAQPMDSTGPPGGRLLGPVEFLADDLSGSDVSLRILRAVREQCGDDLHRPLGLTFRFKSNEQSRLISSVSIENLSIDMGRRTLDESLDKLRFILTRDDQGSVYDAHVILETGSAKQANNDETGWTPSTRTFIGTVLIQQEMDSRRPRILSKAKLEYDKKLVELASNNHPDGDVIVEPPPQIVEPPSFFQKYWWYILAGTVLFSVMSGGNNNERARSSSARRTPNQSAG